jgi:hypothetical protein
MLELPKLHSSVLKNNAQPHGDVNGVGLQPAQRDILTVELNVNE